LNAKDLTPLEFKIKAGH